MGSNPTQAYFWPAVNKRPNRHWTGYFLTQPEEIFFIRRKKMKNLGFLGEIFKTQTLDGWLYPTRSEQQKFDQTWVKKSWCEPITSLNPYLKPTSLYSLLYIVSVRRPLELNNMQRSTNVLKHCGYSKNLVFADDDETVLHILPFRTPIHITPTLLQIQFIKNTI